MRFRAKREKSSGRVRVHAEPERGLRGQSEVGGADQLKAALRQHAREAERQREGLEAELDVLKQTLRRRVQEVAARENELKEAIRRAEEDRDGRGRRGKRSRGHLAEREAALEERARELDALAEELACRERELERSERAARRTTS